MAQLCEGRREGVKQDKDVNISICSCECYGGHGGGVTPNARKILFSTPVVSVAERLCSSRLWYQDTAASSKVIEVGSVTLLLRFVSRMLMHVVPGARGS